MKSFDLLCYLGNKKCSLSCWSVNADYSREESSFQGRCKPSISSQNLWCAVSVSWYRPASLLSHSEAPRAEISVQHKCKEDRTKDRGKERGKQSDMFLFSSGQTDRHMCGLIRLSLQYPHLSFDDPSHGFFYTACVSLSVFFTHTCCIYPFPESTFVSLSSAPLSPPPFS